MCTVSFIPTNEGVIITSNRDESIFRGNTIGPMEYVFNNVKCTYPKDEKGQGTWIGFNQHQSIAVLLNGAFSKHNHQPPYTKSRGVIIPFILNTNNAFTTLELFNFNGMEPFTIILYSINLLFEYRWDGYKLHKKKLHTNTCYLWNSCTLYATTTEQNNIQELEKLYHTAINENEILTFHKSKKYEIQLPQNSLKNNIKTISITQIICKGNNTTINYLAV